MAEHQHTDACLKLQVEDAAYLAQWPVYHKACKGTGEISYQDDPSPAGVGLSGGSCPWRKHSGAVRW